MASDETSRNELLREAETAAEFLRLVNESRELEGLLRALTGFIQKQTGCEAVGIRLKQGDDYPYFETRGFPEEFVRAERWLCARDEAGAPLRDTSGKPVMECMCGNVLQGRTDPSFPFFTAGGSFWSNGTTKLLASATDADRQARTRNRCNGEGYESVALIPLRSGNGALGLLQLNDRREGCFTLEMITLWERLAGYLAIAVAKFEAEEALRENEARYKTVFRTGFLGIGITHLTSGRFEEVNDAFCQLVGYSREEVIGRTSSELGLWVVGAERSALLEELREKGRVVGFECRARRKSGEIRTLAMSAEIVQFEGEGHVVATGSDVTDRKRAEEELGHFFAVVPDLICIASTDTYFKKLNTAWEILLGYSREELLATPFVDLVHPDDRDATLGTVETQIAGRSVLYFENRYRCKDGSYRWLEWMSTPVKGSDRIFAAARDVTERKVAERETARLLEQTRRDDEAKGRLVREINHRVKNNLVSLLGLLLAEKRGLPPSARPWAEAAVDRMADRIRGMLTAHEMLSDAEWAPLSLSELSRRVVQQVLGHALAAGRCSLEVRPSELQVSPRQVSSLALVLNELATNTLKYAAAKQERVTVAVRIEEEEEFCSLEYRDNGPGYPASVLAGEFPSVGLGLVSGLVCGTLRGSFSLSNDGGAVTTIRFRKEDPATT